MHNQRSYLTFGNKFKLSRWAPGHLVFTRWSQLSLGCVVEFCRFFFFSWCNSLDSSMLGFVQPSFIGLDPARHLRRRVFVAVNVEQWTMVQRLNWKEEWLWTIKRQVICLPLIAQKWRIRMSPKVSSPKSMQAKTRTQMFTLQTKASSEDVVRSRGGPWRNKMFDPVGLLLGQPEYPQSLSCSNHISSVPCLNSTWGRQLTEDLYGVWRIWAKLEWFSLILRIHGLKLTTFMFSMKIIKVRKSRDSRSSLVGTFFHTRQEPITFTCARISWKQCTVVTHYI